MDWGYEDRYTTPILGKMQRDMRAANNVLVRYLSQTQRLLTGGAFGAALRSAFTFWNCICGGP